MNWRKVMDRAGANIVLWVAVLFFLLPSFWTIATSFKPPSEYYVTPPRMLPANPTTYHYYEAFYPEGINTVFTKASAYWVEEAAGRTNPVTPAVLNSVEVTLATALLSLLIGMPAAYALRAMTSAGPKIWRPGCSAPAWCPQSSP